MKVGYFRKKNLGCGIAGFLLVGLLAFVFMRISSQQMAALPAQVIYLGSSGQKAAAICINVDWGEEYLPGMLELLKKQDTKVTFFVTGYWAEKHPELVRQMNQEGHSLQNHGYKHVHFNTLSDEQIKEQIMKSGQTIKNLTGRECKYFAPPYGEFNKNVVTTAKNLNYQVIMWSIDTIDWEIPAAGTIVKRVMNGLHNDAIILMHPTQPTAEALPEVLTQINKSGYRILTLDQIIQPAHARKNYEETNL